MNHAEVSLIEWSQNNPQLLLPIVEIKGSFGKLEEVRYKGGYLPGFSLNLKFDLVYSTNAADGKDSVIAQTASLSK